VADRGYRLEKGKISRHDFLKMESSPPPAWSRRASSASAWLSIAAAIATIALKAFAWWLTGSSAGLRRARIARQPAAALLCSTLRLVTFAARGPSLRPVKAEYISAGGGAHRPAAGGISSPRSRASSTRPLDAPFLGLGITVVASLINLGVALVLMHAGKRHDSITLEADGKHLMTASGPRGGHRRRHSSTSPAGSAFPLVALAVASTSCGPVSLCAARRGPPRRRHRPQDQNEVNKIFTEYTRRYAVKFHAFRTRQAGSRRFIAFHLLVPDEWSVLRAHQLSEEIEERIRSLVPNSGVFVHIEPISDPASYDDEGLDRM
jgi:divalent metal cation (Fe/Co/Zn/Cd) transporter